MELTDLDTHQAEQVLSSFADHLEQNIDLLYSTLSQYQSLAITIDEFDRSMQSLRDISDIKVHLTRRTKRIAVIFPLNLPLYSLTLYAIVHSLFGDEVYLRPPEKMTRVFG